MMFRSIIPTETIAMALSMVRANKLRSFLTVLGIVIGVTVVIAVASILTGLRGVIVSMVEDYGTNNIYAFHLTTGPRIGERDRSEYMRKPLTPEDAEAIRQQAVAIEDVANVLFLWRLDRTIKCRGRSYKEGFLQGVSPSYARVTNVSLQQGRFISEVDDQHRRDVMVIGVNVVESLFPSQASVAGEQVELMGRPFEIVGVLEKRKNTFFGENEEDNAIFIPFETGRKLSPISKEMNLNIKARTGMLRDGLDQVRRRPVRDRDLGRGPAGRRHRRDEHHARQRHRAHPRDRRPKGHRRPQTRHRPPVPVRGHDADRTRRNPRSDPRRRGQLCDHVLPAPTPCLDPALGRRERDGRLDPGRTGLRRLAREEGRQPRPNRVS